MTTIGGVPESLVTESNSGERDFLSIYRIRALPADDQKRIREVLANNPDWWPIIQGWIYSPIEENANGQ